MDFNREERAKSSFFWRSLANLTVKLLQVKY